MKSSVNVEWMDGMAFEAEVNGHKILLDAGVDNGGQDKGPRPKPLMMVALAGCTGMDIVSLLKKMRVEFTKLNIIVEGETAEEHPKKFTDMKVIFEITGNNVDREKVEKAVALSEEKYCGVNASYKEVIRMSSEIRILPG